MGKNAKKTTKITAVKLIIIMQADTKNYIKKIKAEDRCFGQKRGKNVRSKKAY